MSQPQLQGKRIFKTYEEYKKDRKAEVAAIAQQADLTASPYVSLPYCETEAEYLKMVGANYLKILVHHDLSNDFSEW